MFLPNLVFELELNQLFELDKLLVSVVSNWLDVEVFFKEIWSDWKLIFVSSLPEIFSKLLFPLQ